MNDFLQKSGLTHALGIDKIRTLSYEYNTPCYDQKLFDVLGIPFPSSLHNAVAKRQAEYLAGRFTAWLALNAIGITVDEISIGINRSPVWPAGIVASITHGNSTTFCAVAFERDIKYLGVDLECVLTFDQAHEVKSTIICDIEVAILNATNLSFEKAVTLVFSAKESLFKALHPYVRRYFDFDAARVTRICTDTRSITLELTCDLTNNFPKGSEISGRYYYDNNCVLTCIYDEA